MKILYAVQCTGNGHLSRAMEIIPFLQKRGELDILLSGSQSDLLFPYPVKYRFHGLSFVFGKKGGVDMFRTYLQMQSRKLIREIGNLPVEDYDIIINDFEPVSAWAAYRSKLPCIALSNQCTILSENVPKAKHRDLVGEMVLKYYAPSTSQYGFHFASFDSNIYTPIIRREVRNLKIRDEEHYTVYLPAYDDERLIKNLTKFSDVKWQVFSKHNKIEVREKNVFIRPIENESFLKSMASCTGVLCAAGFGTAAEALYLNKKLLVIPMKNQYEQHCNAAALKSLGIPVMKSLKKKHFNHLEDWIQNGKPARVNYPDITDNIIEKIFDDHFIGKERPLKIIGQ
jgi:uncharacterized protein (TIGR00661 family)